MSELNEKWVEHRRRASFELGQAIGGIHLSTRRGHLSNAFRILSGVPLDDRSDHIIQMQLRIIRQEIAKERRPEFEELLERSGIVVEELKLS